MTQETTRKGASTAVRAVLLALTVVMLLGAVLALPNRTRADEAQATAASQMLVFDWNKPVQIGMSGFAQYKPLSAFPQFPNGNWVAPVNYIQGTLYFRAKVISIPRQPRGMKLGFCFWQNKPKYGEECTPNPSVPTNGTEARWSVRMNDLFEINRKPIDWTLPRWKAGFVVRNSKGKPVSNKLNFNWSGEDPAAWYPLNIHFSAVLVAPGGGEPNWTQYGWPTP
jgi:hypothetical protein